MSFWDNLWARLQSLGEAVMQWLVLLVLAAAIFFVGRWLIGLVRSWVRQVVDSPALRGMWERSAVARALQPTNQTPGSVTGTIVYAYLMVGLLVVVARVLEADPIEDLLARLLAWIPMILLAVVVVIIAAAAGGWAAGLVRPFAHEHNIPWLTHVVRIGVIIFGVLFAMDLLRIEFAEDVVKILVTAAALALTIAFGVGGIDAARKWWARYGTPSEIEGGDHSKPDVT